MGRNTVMLTRNRKIIVSLLLAQRSKLGKPGPKQIHVLAQSISMNRINFRRSELPVN